MSKKLLISAACYAALAPALILAPMPVVAANGTLVVFDKNDAKCSISVDGPGSGITKQINLIAIGASESCHEFEPRNIALNNLPSATQILMTENRWCSTNESDTDHWIKLKTIKQPTTTTNLELEDIYTYTAGQVIKPGLQLIDKYQKSGSTARDTVQCIEITTSRGIESPPPVAVEKDTDVTTHTVSRESNTNFTCPDHKVMTRREHSGDENKSTDYDCVSLKQKNNRITLTATDWSVNIDEDDGTWFSCPANEVLVGRKHKGDETRKTSYRCAKASVNGHALTVKPGSWLSEQREYESDLECTGNSVMIGRRHVQDENGKSTVRCATLQ